VFVGLWLRVGRRDRRWGKGVFAGLWLRVGRPTRQAVGGARRSKWQPEVNATSRMGPRTKNQRSKKDCRSKPGCAWNGMYGGGKCSLISFEMDNDVCEHKGGLKTSAVRRAALPWVAAPGTTGRAEELALLMCHIWGCSLDLPLVHTWVAFKDDLATFRSPSPPQLPRHHQVSLMCSVICVVANHAFGFRLFCLAQSGGLT
jgi:hypothetical protein